MFDIRVQESDFSLNEEYERLVAAVGQECGAVASFVGLVRGSDSDSKVVGLELEHYPGMTESSISQIIEQARERWSLQGAVVLHRIGKIPSGSQIVLVIVASSHRPDAFSACEFVMDYLKTEAVFWKKEIREDGDIWIRSTTNDVSRRDEWATTK